MRKLALSLLLALAPAALSAQTTKNVVLNWTANADGSDTGGTYNAYRAVGACGTSGQKFIAIKTGITALTYTDASITPGIYCYYVTAVVNTSESSASNTAGITAPPSAPTGFTVVIQ